MKSKLILMYTILFIILFACTAYAVDNNTQVLTVEIPTIDESITTSSEEKSNEGEKTLSHEHSWKEDSKKSKNSTCTENGYKYYICSECNEIKKEEIKATGHSFGEWKTVEGVKERKCDKCGFVEKEKIEDSKTTPTPTPTVSKNENKIVLHNTNIQNVTSYNILENGILKPSGADKTVANKIIPAAGEKFIVLPILIGLLIMYTAYIKYKKYKKL